MITYVHVIMFTQLHQLLLVSTDRRILLYIRAPSMPVKSSFPTQCSSVRVSPQYSYYPLFIYDPRHKQVAVADLFP